MLFAKIRSDNLVPLNSSVKQDIIISLIRLEISSKLKRKKGTELIFTNYFIFVFLSFYIYIVIMCFCYCFQLEMLKYLYMWEYAQINWFLKEGLVLLVCATTSDEQISGEQFFLNKKNKKNLCMHRKMGRNCHYTWTI